MRWKRSARSLGSSQPSVTMVFQRAVDDFVAHIEKAGAFGAISHLCGLDEYMFATKIVNVRPVMANDVRAVDGGENSLRAGERAELLRRQHDASDCGDVAEEDDAGAGSDGVIEKIEDLGGVFLQGGARRLSSPQRHSVWP